MEKPVCKLCGKRHWSRESCTVNSGAAASKPVLLEADVDVAKRKGLGRTARGDGEGKSAETPTSAETYEERVKRLARERQRRFRERRK